MISLDNPEATVAPNQQPLEQREGRLKRGRDLSDGGSTTSLVQETLNIWNDASLDAAHQLLLLVLALQQVASFSWADADGRVRA